MKQNRYFQITVIGDSSASLELCELAEATGKLLAEMGIVVITGGRGGIMEAVSKGVADIGGLSIGIIPSDKLEDANSYCSVVIPTGIGYSRNFLTVLSCDLVIAIGGRAGTLSEIIYGWVFNKPLLALKGFGGWSDKMAGTAIDDRRTDKIYEFNNITELKELILKFANEKGWVFYKNTLIKNR